MNQDSLRQTVERFNDCISKRDIERLATLMAQDHTFIDKVGNVVAGKEAVLKAWRGFFAAFPDYWNEFEHWEIDGSVVTVRGRSHCSNHRLDGPALWRALACDDKISEWRVYDDTMENRNALGMDPNS